MIKLFMLFLTVWSLGAVGLVLVALSDLVFNPGSWRQLPRRLLLIALWPIAFLSVRGRALLLHVSRETQTKEKAK